jgi:hypothetical protein
MGKRDTRRDPQNAGSALQTLKDGLVWGSLAIRSRTEDWI